jgi:SulP family sulfate permease
MDLEQVLADDHVFPDADRALECAEDRLLQDLAHKPAPGVPLPLAQTMLGNGLGAAELDILAPLLVARRLTAGERVFSHGDAGDSLCVATFGQIGIWLPAGAGQPARRLVSFAPGVVFGEMGLLRGTPRSADALVEEDALVLTLPRAQFEQLAAHHPRLHATLLLNLSLHLSARLGALTDAMHDDGGLN